MAAAYESRLFPLAITTGSDALRSLNWQVGNKQIDPPLVDFPQFQRIFQFLGFDYCEARALKRRFRHFTNPVFIFYQQHNFLIHGTRCRKNPRAN